MPPDPPAAPRRAAKVFNPGTSNEVRALQGVDLAVDDGSFVVVIGTNGSGKSTLLNAIAGSFLVDSGTIALGGQNITRWPEHRRAALVGRVFQNPFSGTAPNMTIAENLTMAARRGRSRGLGLGAQTGHAAGARRSRQPPEAGAGGSPRQRDRQPLGRTAPGAHAADGVLDPAADAAPGRAHGRARSQERRSRRSS